MHRNYYMRRGYKLDRTHNCEPDINKKCICIKKFVNQKFLNDNNMCKIVASAVVGFMSGISLKCLIDKVSY